MWSKRRRGIWSWGGGVVSEGSDADLSLSQAIYLSHKRDKPTYLSHKRFISLTSARTETYLSHKRAHGDLSPSQARTRSRTRRGGSVTDTRGLASAHARTHAHAHGAHAHTRTYTLGVRCVCVCARAGRVVCVRRPPPALAEDALPPPGNPAAWGRNLVRVCMSYAALDSARCVTRTCVRVARPLTRKGGRGARTGHRSRAGS